MVKPYYQDENATLYKADALAVLASLPTASVDALITDPPYSSGGQYKGDRSAATGDKYGGASMSDFSGDNRDQRSRAGERRRTRPPGEDLCGGAEMTRPDHHTSHYGWALWHLEQAENAPDSAALIHATAAQARATLAQIDLAEGRFEGSTWAGSHKRVSP